MWNSVFPPLSPFTSGFTNLFPCPTRACYIIVIDRLLKPTLMLEILFTLIHIGSSKLDPKLNGTYRVLTFSAETKFNFFLYSWTYKDILTSQSSQESLPWSRLRGRKLSALRHHSSDLTLTYSPLQPSLSYPVTCLPISHVFIYVLLRFVFFSFFFLCCLHLLEFTHVIFDSWLGSVRKIVLNSVLFLLLLLRIEGNSFSAEPLLRQLWRLKYIFIFHRWQPHISHESLAPPQLVLRGQGAHGFSCISE